VWLLERSGRGHTPRGACAGASGDGSGVGRGALTSALLEAEAVAVHLQDVDMVGEAVEQSAGEPLRAEDLGPFGEGQIAGDHGGATFIALTEHLEEQFGAGLGERHEAEFIDDEQLVAGDLLLEAEQLLLIVCFDQLADQSRGSSEADAVSALTGSQAEGECDMGLAGAGVAKQQDVLLAQQELAAGQFQDHRLVERGHSEEVEAVEALGDGDPVPR